MEDTHEIQMPDLSRARQEARDLQLMQAGNMILSDIDIRYEMRHNDLLIEPLDDRAFQPASIDLRLGSALRKLNKEPFPITRNGYLLRPGKFILGDTLEYMQIPPHLAAQFAGKSSLGRIGLQTHCTAGFVDPGFRGTLTVELSNLSNQIITLHAGQPIGQLCLIRLSSVAERPYGHPELGSHYMSQTGPTAARRDDEDVQARRQRRAEERDHGTPADRMESEPEPAVHAAPGERLPRGRLLRRGLRHDRRHGSGLPAFDNRATAG
jgi:dCTP deaminase